MICILALALSSVVASDPPLTVAKVTVGPPSQVELRNTGTKPINAWAFAISSRNADGGFHRVVHSADVYLSEVTGGLQGAAPHLQRLNAGESRVVSVDLLPSYASVQVLAVVLDDNTAIGDEQTIASFFHQREVQRDQLKSVVDTFNAVLQQTHGAAALEELHRRFASAGSEDQSVPHRSARDAVEGWLQKAKNATADDQLDASVRSYVAFVTRQYEVAAKHAQRKSG